MGSIIIFVFLSIQITCISSFGYPEFIGIGYGSCLTCHYNGAGGGALNDYGRALYAAEIAARPLGLNEESLVNSSNFFRRLKSPYWLKPSLKYRRLLVESNPRGSLRQTKYYTMQADFGFASFMNDQESLGLVFTLAHAPEPVHRLPNREIKDGSDLMAREYFVRWLSAENHWIYFGFFDKPFGIRHADHTAFNRSLLKLGQNDQTHGLMWHMTSEQKEIFIHLFAGNLHNSEEERFRGASALFEFELMNRLRYLASFMTGASATDQLSAASGALRMGLEQGHALLFELGVKSRRLQGQDPLVGVFQYLELSYLLNRGLHFQSIFQYERSDFQSNYNDNLRWGLGFLYFPLQRIELRSQIIQKKVQSRKDLKEDQWSGQLQLHLSL